MLWFKSALHSRASPLTPCKISDYFLTLIVNLCQVLWWSHILGASKNRLIGIHFAELTYNKMSDTEEAVEEEVQYVHISLSYTLIVEDRMIVNIIVVHFPY